MTTDAREEAVARALVPIMSGSQEDEWGHDLPDKQFDDLTPDWQEAFLGYARAAIAALPTGEEALREALEEVEALIGAIIPSGSREEIRDAARKARDRARAALLTTKPAQTTSPDTPPGSS